MTSIETTFPGIWLFRGFCAEPTSAPPEL